MKPTNTDDGAPRGHDDPRLAAILTEIERLMTGPRYALWCAGKMRASLHDDQLRLAVGSPFLLNCMQNQFQQLFTAAAQAVCGPGATVTLSVDATLSLTSPSLTRKAKRSEPATKPEQVESSDSSPDALPLIEVTSAVPATTVVEQNNTQLLALPRQRRLAELVEFVPGPTTEIALTASRQVAAQPGRQFQLLYLHGGVGTGKTHLLEGICRQLRRTQSSLNVMLLTAEGFANAFTQALRDRTLPSFRQKFRGLDVLLIDDIDFFESKRVFQEEFLHTLADLIDHRRQVVVTGDRHPRLLTRLSDDLISRLQSGMLCRLETPDVETRRKIVQLKAARLDGEYAPEALDWIAERFTGNVRELEGALNCLQTLASMTQRRVTLNAARQVLADLERDCLRIVRLADVERVICQMFGVRSKDLKSDSRVRTLAQPRMLAMFLARKHTQSAYAEIGQHFGGRNHSTVMSAERKVQGWLEENATVRIAAQSWTIGEIVSTLEQQLLAG